MRLSTGLTPCAKYTPIEWGDKKEEEIIWNQNEGYHLIQGKGTVRGRLIGGSAGPLRQMMGTCVFPKEEVWSGGILFLESCSPHNSLLAELHDLRALNAAGIFSNANGLITPGMNSGEKEMLLKFLSDEAGRGDMPVLTNVDFGHRTPMTVLPVGTLAEIDCDNGTFGILETGVEPT